MSQRGADECAAQGVVRESSEVSLVVNCRVYRTMATFEYVELSTRNDLDRRRQRVAVRIRPTTGGAALFLGDVWRSISTDRWHFTMGPGNLRRGDRSAGYRLREDAARALLEARLAEADVHLHEAAEEASALRRASGEDPIFVIVATRSRPSFPTPPPAQAARRTNGGM